MPPVKIGFSGTYSSGKTTLLQKVCERLTTLNVDYVSLHLSELVIQCPFPLNKGQSFSSSIWILAGLMQRELVEETRHTLLLCDRTPLDVWALTELISNENKGSYCQRLLIDEMIRHWLTTFDMIFFLRHDPTLTPNWAKVPDRDLDFRDRAQSLQEQYLKNSNLSFEILPLPTEERCQAVIDHITWRLNL